MDIFDRNFLKKYKLGRYKFRDEIGHNIEMCVDFQEIQAHIVSLESENAALKRVVEAADDLIIGRLDMETYYEVSMEDMTALDDAIDALKTGKEAK